MISSFTNVQAVIDIYPAVGSASAVNSATIFGYIEDVTNEIDSKIGRRYTLPISSGAPVLQSIAKRMSLYDLLTIRVMAEWSKEDMKNASFFERLKEAREQLDAIAAGTQLIYNSSGTLITQRTDIVEVWSNTKDYNQTFHEGSQYDTVQDTDKIDTILGDRGLE